MFECENHLQIVFMISEDQSANLSGEEYPCTTGRYQKNMPYWDAPSVEPWSQSDGLCEGQKKMKKPFQIWGNARWTKQNPYIYNTYCVYIYMYNPWTRWKNEQRPLEKRWHRHKWLKFSTEMPRTMGYDRQGVGASENSGLPESACSKWQCL